MNVTVGASSKGVFVTMTVVHIGYPKAASSTLQTGLFLHHNELTNLGLYPTANVGTASARCLGECASYSTDSRLPVLYDRLVHQDGILFDENSTRALWKSIEDEYGQANPGKTLILSHEGISSSRFANSELVEKARRLKLLIPDARILIIIRSQLEMLKSLYRDCPFDPRSIEYKPRPVSFSEWLDVDLSRRHFRLSSSLLFSRLVSVYERLFGEEEVLVLPLELLGRNRAAFCGELSSFLDIDERETARLLSAPADNTGISRIGNQYRRATRSLFPSGRLRAVLKRQLAPLDKRILDSLKKIGGSERIVSNARDLQKVKNLYSADNTLLSERRCLGLRELDYPMS